MFPGLGVSYRFNTEYSGKIRAPHSALSLAQTGVVGIMKKQRQKEFDDWFELADKVTHQCGLLLMMWIGLIFALVSTTVVSLLGVQELLRRLAH